MPNISGTVITYNEEDHIEDCIASLQRVCSEIIVVDSLSTDRTVELAKACGARIIHQKYLGEGKQRNLTEQHAGHDWILALDADERLDDEMYEAVKNADLNDPRVAYAFNRKSFVGNHWVKAPGFYPDYVTRLYNRQKAGYEPRYGHAGVKAPTVKKLNGHIIHLTYDNLSDWVARINQVSSLDARGMYEAGRKPSRFKPTLSALSAVFRQLILRGGLFYGVDGQNIAITSMFRAYLKYWKLNELHEQGNKSRPKT